MKLQIIQTNKGNLKKIEMYLDGAPIGHYKEDDSKLLTGTTHQTHGGVFSKGIQMFYVNNVQMPFCMPERPNENSTPEQIESWVNKVKEVKAWANSVKEGISFTYDI